MKSLDRARLIKGVGIEGDRYANATGTYSAKFLGEPGKHLTMLSADGVEATVAATAGMEPFESLSELRRNLVVRGLSAAALNDMVGHEVKVGPARLFVHRLTVPCKYREAQTRRPGLMDALWDVCGVNCEVLEGGDVRVGDKVALVPNSHQPKRANPGFKPPGFFVRPRERTAAQAKAMIIPPHVAAIMSLVDPAGFQRVEDGYASVGQHFWSPRAYRAGQWARRLRGPLLLALGAGAALLLAAGVYTASGAAAWRQA